MGAVTDPDPGSGARGAATPAGAPLTSDPADAPPASTPADAPPASTPADAPPASTPAEPPPDASPARPRRQHRPPPTATPGDPAPNPEPRLSPWERRSGGEVGPGPELTDAETPPSAQPDDLRAVPLFAALSDVNLASLARTVVKRRAGTDDVLCREGERGDEMYVVLSGAVTLHKTVEGRETELGRLESGAYFGEMALIGDAPRSATIRVAEDLEYLAIDRETLMEVIAAHPVVALQILRGYNERLADTTERLARLSARLTAQPAAGALRGERAAPPDGPPDPHQAAEQAVLFAPHPLAVLARRLLVEDKWDRKVLLALDVYELAVKYTVFLLLAEYLRRPDLRAPDVDQMVLAAFRRPTLGLLLDMCPRVLRAYASRAQEPFVPCLAALHLRPEGGRAPAARALQLLTTYRNRLKHGAEGVWDEERFRQDFEGNPAERLPNGERRYGLQHHLAAILDALTLLREYPLVYLTSMTYEHGMFEYAYERCTGAYSSFDRGVFASHEPLENRRLYVLSQVDERALPLDPFLRRQRCPTCNVPAIFLLFSAGLERERPRRDTSAPAADPRGRRKERLEYLSYACGHTLTDQLTPERIARGEGITRLFE